MKTNEPAEMTISIQFTKKELEELREILYGKESDAYSAKWARRYAYLRKKLTV